MPSYTVGASTSVVLLDTSSLGSGDSAIVYLSTPTTPGQIVTVRDSLGYLSSPQSILVSTTAGVSFADGTSSIRVTTPFASLSFSGAPPSAWAIVNTFGFPLYDTVANVRQLTASTLTGQAITIGGGLSTTSIVANSLTITSTGTVQGPLYVSTLVVGPEGTDPAGNSVLVLGSATIGSTLSVGGNLTVGQSTTIGGNLVVQSNLTIGGTTTFGGGLSVGGNVTTGPITAESLLVVSSATILGATTFNSTVTVASNLDVFQTATAANFTASTLTINTGGYLQLGTLLGPRLTASTINGQATASWNSPFYAPYISSGTLQANSASAGILAVSGTISAPTVSQVLFGNAAITNANGSLTLSSLTANVLTLSNTFVAQGIAVSTLTASSLQVSGAATFTSPIGFLSSASATVSTVAAGQISSGLVNAGIILTPALTVSSLTVAQTIDGGTSLSSITFPSATIVNSAGRILTNSLTATTLTASTVIAQSGSIQSPSTIRIQASTVQLDTTYVSSLTASTIQASTIQTTRIIVGAPLTGSNGPDFYYDPTPAVSTNIVITGGPGDYLSPFFLSNVIPPGQNPAVPYTTFVSFETDFKSLPSPPGLLIEYGATLFWAGEVNSQLAITGGPTLFGISGTNTSTTGTLSQSTFRINASLYGASAISVNFKYRYTPNANSIDSNSVVEFNNGRLYWNYALNGTTIQNSLNDMTTRNLYYYGSLNFASDPRIKENIQAADLKRCYETIGTLPLHLYRYTDAYCSTFRTPKTQRLGLMATELAEVFPHSVQASDLLLPDGSAPMLTIDTSQVEMAHLGATKYLMGEVERLERLVEALESARSQ